MQRNGFANQIFRAMANPETEATAEQGGSAMSKLMERVKGMNRMVLIGIGATTCLLLLTTITSVSSTTFYP